MVTDELEKTPRRESRESFARYLLANVGLEAEDIDEFLSTKQVVLENKSPLELIYSGEYERAMNAVYALADCLED